MTFSDLVEYAVTLNYKTDPQENCNKILLDESDSFVELSFPNDDNIESFLNSEGVNIDWEYRIVNKLNGEKIHSEWFDYYDGSAAKKIQDMKKDILEFVDNFASKKYSIVERSVFSLFGKKFLKFKELIFE